MAIKTTSKLNKLPYQIKEDFDNSSKFSRKLLKEYGNLRNLTGLIEGAGISGLTDALEMHTNGIKSIIVYDKRINSESRNNIIALTDETLVYLEYLNIDRTYAKSNFKEGFFNSLII